MAALRSVGVGLAQSSAPWRPCGQVQDSHCALHTALPTASHVCSLDEQGKSKGREGERPAARRQGDRDRWGVKGEKGVSVRAPTTGGALTPEPCCNLTGINSMNAPDSFCH